MIILGLGIVKKRKVQIIYIISSFATVREQLRQQESGSLPIPVKKVGSKLDNIVIFLTLVHVPKYPFKTFNALKVIHLLSFPLVSILVSKLLGVRSRIH